MAKLTEKITIESNNTFILVEWSLNKVFTVLLNNKSVKLNQLVTCKVNNTQDIGKVVFIGIVF